MALGFDVGDWVIPFQKSIGVSWENSDTANRIDRKLKAVFTIENIETTSDGDDDGGDVGNCYYIDGEMFAERDVIAPLISEIERLYYTGKINTDRFNFYMNKLR
jgi:hypothetical protein